MIKTHINKNQLFLAVLTLLALLSGCDNNESTLTTQSTTITGTAATGLAIDGLVTATSSSGNMSEQVGINADGLFSVEIEGEPPFLLMAQSTDGNITLFSIGFVAGTTNITPFSHQVIQDLYSDKQLAAVFNNWSAENTSVDEQSVSKSVASLVNATASEFASVGIEMTTFDALRSPFITNHTGFDAVLDSVASSLPAGTPTVDGSISYTSDASNQPSNESGGLIFIDPNDPTEIPDDADMPTIPILNSPDEQIFVDSSDPTDIPDDADIGTIPALNAPEEMIFIDPNDDTVISDDADIGTIDLK